MSDNTVSGSCDRCGAEVKDAKASKFVLHCPACIHELNHKFEHVKANTESFDDE